ncbi:maltose acetyltransferase domain-containing protein, partial [Vibrio cholerae]
MTELEKMMSGQVFDGMDKEIDAIRTQATLALRALNNNTDESKRDELQKQ